MSITSVFALCEILGCANLAAQVIVPQPNNAKSYDSDPAMQTFNNGHESGTFYSHPGFSSHPRRPYVAGTKKRFAVVLPSYCRAKLSLDMTNTSNFNMRDYDFGVMFDGALALNLGKSMCDRASYDNLQQKGSNNYQLVNPNIKSATRTFLSSTNVAVFDFCAHPYNKDTDATRRLGFATKWSCVRSSPNPTTVQKTTTTKRTTTKRTTTKRTTSTTLRPTTVLTHPTVAPVNTDCGTPINSDNRPASMFQRIVGGVKPAPNAWPWAAAVVASEQLHFCGASVLNSQWVITAAHCIKKVGTEENFQKAVKIYYGSQNLWEVPDSQKASIARVIIHPNVTEKNWGNDMALIKLTAPIPDFPNSMVSPICLPSHAIGTFKAQAYSTKNRPYAYVAGWGALKADQPKPTLADFKNGLNVTVVAGSHQLMQTTIEVFSDKECHAVYDGTDIGSLADASICGGLVEGGRDACQGDSGGPLVMAEPPGYRRYSLYGIVSQGRSCADPGVPGAYTDVFKLKKWITDTMASN
ncbi:transmembrane protease serine 9-like [Paramacrobiotus metropolitanus]|uniref:transmembrane protease serine 9-like n=1 Tax=Paramacrobiotus metropolitanus TaxID=2943436 RepID=UPI002445D2E3|nr:transmembrane protease serine 9-like [Paramacrobiotus metropolitanus]